MKLEFLLIEIHEIRQAAVRPRCGRPAPRGVKPGTAKNRRSEGVRVAFQEFEEGIAWAERAQCRLARTDFEKLAESELKVLK